MRALGVDLGGTKIEGVVLDEALRPVHRVRVETERERGYDHILGRVAEVVAALRPHAPDARLVGIGTPGSLSARDGTLKNSNTTCLNGRPVHADLERRLGMPVRLENDLDCFGRALANVIDILDPDAVVLGGGLSNLDVLYTRGRDAVARYVFNDELRTPIVPNRLGDSAGVIGAALLTV